MPIASIRFLSIMGLLIGSGIAIFVWACMQKTEYQKMLRNIKKGGKEL